MSSTSFMDTLRRNTGLAVGIVVIFILLTVGIWWLLRPSYEILVQGLQEESRAEVLASLMQQQVPYEVEEGTGNILVPSTQVSELRAQLSAQGLPSKQAVGLELFSQGDYGMSEFAQRINYQRALEGELARTVQSIEEVRHARVHITLGKTSIFENRREPAKASVVLQLKSARVLTGAQVYGIQQLVAAAVPALMTDQVVVLDDMGRSLSSTDGLGGSDRWSSVRQLEQEYEARVRTLLAGALPDANFQLSVKLQVNFDKIKSVKEEIIPAKGMQTGYLLKKRDQVSSGQSGGGQAVSGTQNNNNSETEYLFGRERAEIERAVGNIERVNVAVIASQPLSAQLTETLRTVIQAGLGLVGDRGDSVAIIGVAAQLTDDSAPAGETIGPAESQEAGTTSTSGAIGWSMIGLYGFGVATLLLLSVVAAGRRGRPVPASQARLSDAERERLLQQVRLWLTHDSAR